MAEGERQPLLSDKKEALPSAPPPDYTEVASQPYPGSIQAGPATAPDELPPPYTPGSQGLGTVPTINCKICQAIINLEGKTHQHVVKCGVCNEATAIKAAPPGKKYVRCPCNCLLVCKTTSLKIACPRPHCKRIINLGPATVTVTTRSIATKRVRCGHCHDTFLFNTLNNALARCPHCRKVSSVGPQFARTRACIFTSIGLFFLLVGIGVTVGTYELASQSGGIYVVYIGAFIVGLANLLRGLYFGCMTVSFVTDAE